jgi:hypothetical protein
MPFTIFLDRKYPLHYSGLNDFLRNSLPTCRDDKDLKNPARLFQDFSLSLPEEIARPERFTVWIYASFTGPGLFQTQKTINITKMRRVKL